MAKGNVTDMKNKKVLIVGMGNSGKAAAQAMVKLGADVSVQDNKSEDSIDPQLLMFLREKSVKCYLGCQPAIAAAASPPPSASDPVSPMNIFAGFLLNTRNPRHPPHTAAQKYAPAASP